DVAGAGARSSDRVAGRASDDEDAAVVGDRTGPGGVRADVVARDGVGRRPRAADQDPAVGVAGKHVARGGGRAADRVPVRAGGHLDALVVRDGRRPVRADTDQVALHGVRGRPTAGEEDAVRVRSEHVRRADRVAVRARRQLDAVPVADGADSVDVDADVVALDDVGGRRRAAEEDAVAVVPEEVPGVRDRAADRVLARAGLDRDAVLAGEQLVAGDDVAARAGSADRDAVRRVEADDVERARRRPTDRVPGGAAGDRDPGRAVRGARLPGILADPVAGDDVAARPRALDPDAVGGVPLDQVARSRDRSADCVLARAGVDLDADESGRQAAGGIADLVACDDVLLRARARELDRGAEAAGDRVAGAAPGAADRVAPDGVPVRAVDRERHLARVGADHVPLGRGRPPDRVRRGAGVDPHAAAFVREEPGVAFARPDVVADDDVAGR